MRNRTDGFEYDSTYDRMNPAVFVVGKGQVIKGLDQGFIGLRVGAQAIINCPPDYAYGGQGTNNFDLVPPHTTLFFEAKLLGIC